MLKKGVCAVLVLGALLLSTSTATAAVGSLVLEVPLIRQEQSNTCWAASARMVLAWNGYQKDECTLVKHVWVFCFNNTATINNVQGLLWAFGGLYSSTANRVLRFDEIQTYIGKSQPFVFRWAWPDGGGHFLVGTGWQKDASGVEWVYFNDPWMTGQGKYKMTYEYVRHDAEGDLPHIWTHSLYDIHKE